MEDKERLYYKLGEVADEKIVRHIRRYDFSASCLLDSKLKGSKILDFGCGSGYGSKLLTIAFPDTNIVSYDVSKEAIEYAKENNGHEHINYAEDYEIVKNSAPYDSIFLIDMIEHLETSERDRVMKDLMETSPSAVFFISTPLNDYVGQSPSNPHHINCFNREAFEVFLKQYFSSAELWHVDWNFSRLMAPGEPFGKVIAICKK